MPVSNGKITAPVNVSDVKSALGVSTNDVGTLCAKASSGGTNGFAFSIVEAGGNTGMGNLITGAEPLYNKFSPKQPAEWTPSISGGLWASYRLKRWMIDNSRYGFGLHHFDGYDHNAASPSCPDVTIAGTLNQAVDVSTRYSIGSYDWERVFPLCKMCLAELNSAGNIITGRTSALVDISHGTQLGNYTTSVGANGEVRQLVIAIFQGTSPIAYLPLPGSITFKLNQPSTATITIIADDYIGISNNINLGGTWGSSSIIGDIRRTASTPNRTLYLSKVHVRCTNNGQSTYNSDRAMNATYDTIELNPREWGVGSNMPVSAYMPAAVWNAINSTNSIVDITMYYN